MARWPKTDKWGGKMYWVKYSLLNDITRRSSYSGVPHGYVNRIRIWPLRRDYHPGILIGAVGRRRSDWPARVLANDVSTRIGRYPAREERSIARMQGQVVASCHRFPTNALKVCVNCRPPGSPIGAFRSRLQPSGGGRIPPTFRACYVKSATLGS